LPELTNRVTYQKFYITESTSFYSSFYNQLPSRQVIKTGIRIKRIKFKPGYMNYWRQARSELKKTLNLKLTYQFNLTFYLLKLNKFNSHIAFLIRELSIINLLHLSRVILVKQFVNEFLQNHLVFVNGTCVTDPSFQLYKFDLIQLIVHLKYYMFFKYFLNILLKNKFFIKKILRYKNRFTYINKKRPSTLSEKLKSRFNPDNDIPAYLEVDFLSLAVYILYEPTLFMDFSLYQHYLNRSNVLRLYNWKYIT